MNEKTYQIGVSWNEDVLEIVITGQRSVKNAKEMAQDIFKILDEHRPNKVLVDSIKVSGRLEIAEIYFHVQEYPSPIERYRPKKVAVLDKPENKSLASFYEVAAANVFLPLKFFTNKNEALRWLVN